MRTYEDLCLYILEKVPGEVEEVALPGEVYGMCLSGGELLVAADDAGRRRTLPDWDRDRDRRRRGLLHSMRTRWCT